MKQPHSSYNQVYNSNTRFKRSNPPLLSPVRHTHNAIPSAHKVLPIQHHSSNRPIHPAAAQKTDETYFIPASRAAQWQQELATNIDPPTKDRLNTRINALSHKHITTTSPPHIHPNTYAFAHRYAINLDDVIPTNSPLIAHALYKEYVDILQTAAHIPTQHNEIILDALGQASNIGLTANQTGYIEHASQLADFCWTILDYTKAVGEGVYLGATNTLHTLTHPIETAKNALIGIGIITYALGKTIDIINFVEEAAFLYTIDNDQFFLRYNAIIDQLETISTEANKYFSSTSTRNLVKQGTAFITEGILLSKIFSLAQDISNRILPIAEHCLEFITKEESLARLVNGEIIAIEMPTGMNTGSFENNILKIESNPALNHNSLISKSYEVNGFKNLSKPILEIKHPVLDNIRTGSALKLDAHHAFHDLIDNFAQTAEKFSLKGNDGTLRKLYQIEGSLNGIDGVFEWIVDPRPHYGVMHRLFIKNGKITGRPNAF